jgi:hypothetical protein
MMWRMQTRAYVGVGAGVGVDDGAGVGVDVGAGEGVDVGAGLGVVVGPGVGVSVGENVGAEVGAGLGVDVGGAVGVSVGLAVGVEVGAGVGVDVGAGLGVEVGAGVIVSVGEVVGVDVGASVGVDIGVGVVGVEVGALDGAALGAGVTHTDDRELHVGYAVWSVEPQLSDTPRLMQSAMVALSNAEVKLVTRSTFHNAIFVLKADALRNACTRGPRPQNVLENSARIPVSACVRRNTHTHARARAHFKDTSSRAHTHTRWLRHIQHRPSAFAPNRAGGRRPRIPRTSPSPTRCSTRRCSRRMLTLTGTSVSRTTRGPHRRKVIESWAQDTREYACMSRRTRVHRNTHACTRRHTSTHTNIHARKRTRTNTRTHGRTHVRLRSVGTRR